MSKSVLMTFMAWQVEVLRSMNITNELDKCKFLMDNGQNMRNEWRQLRKNEALSTPKHQLLKLFDSNELREYGFDVETISIECKRYNERRCA